MPAQTFLLTLLSAKISHRDAAGPGLNVHENAKINLLNHCV